MLHSCQLAREPYFAVRERKFVTSLFLSSILFCLYIHISLLNRSMIVWKGQHIPNRVLVFLEEGVTCVVSSSKVKCGFYGHRSSNSIFFSGLLFSFSLGDKPLSVILDCYHRLILVLISVWLTSPSALKDKVIHVHPHSPSCFVPFNTCCHEPCFTAVSFPHWFSWGLKPKSCLFWEGGEQALARLATGVGRALSMRLSWLQSTKEFNTCMVLGVSFLIIQPVFCLSPPPPVCVNPINVSCSLHQISTRIFPVACYRLQSWVYLFQTARVKIRKTGFKLKKRTSLICCLWPKVQHKAGALCFSSLACISVSCVTAWWASRVRCVQPLLAVPQMLSSGWLQRCKLGSICPNGMAEQAFVYPKW